MLATRRESGALQIGDVAGTPRSLLGLCVLGIGLVKVPLVPTKLSTFGIEFSQLNQQAFIYLYAAVVAYFLLP